MANIINSTDLHQKSGTSSDKKTKTTILLIALFSFFAIYVLILFKMQVIEGAGYRMQSVNISQRSTILPAQRGEIYDRNANMALAINTDSFAVYLTPGEAGADYDSVAARLAQYLGITKSEIDARVESKKSYTSYEVKAYVTFDEISNIAENITDLPGVSWASKPIRNYIVEAKSLSHVIGYVGDITKEELKVMYNSGYTSNSVVGKMGIEKQYDSLLQGKTGKEYRTVDVYGKKISETPITEPPVMGNNLVLTIDTTIQKLAEQALGERVGAAVVLKPSNGEILAMVSYPYFDANIFNTENASKEYTKLEKSSNNPLLNRAINATYPPASTFKVVMSTAMLAEDVMPSSKEIECEGYLDYGGRTFKCHVGIPGHGYLDLKNGLAESCNVYYWTVGRDYLGVDLISSYSKDFGYGEDLNIDLPSSSAGFVPTSQWKERRYHEKWLGGDTMNLSIGQSYTLVTPLHVANMMAMVTNEGKIYQPHILKEVRDSVTDEVIREYDPKVLHSMDIDSAVWKEIKEDLRYTVTDGSAQFPLNNKVVQFAGKSGTAEVSGYTNSWHSWFVAYGPYDAPVEDQVVVCVLVEACNPWEWWAPYASNIIFQGIFANQTYDEAIDALGFRYLVRPMGRQE